MNDENGQIVQVKDDLTGKTFNRLTVIKRVDDYVSPKGYRDAQYLCECSCEEHNQLVVPSKSLRSKHTRSCGCIQKEFAVELGCNSRYVNKKYNDYDLSGEYGIGYTSKGDEFYFDLEDYDKIKDYCWHISNGYVHAHYIKNGKKTSIVMHQLILPNAKVVDHKNGKSSRNDNRKDNLRECTTSQNAMNVGLRSNNTSGVTGVYWIKSRNKWRASICLNGKNKYLGHFSDFNDAVTIRKQAEKKYFGEFRYNNKDNVS